MSKDDDFPYASDDPELRPPVAQLGGLESDQQAEQEFRILLRFLIGSAVEGNDEFWRRARTWQAEVNKARLSGTAISPSIEAEGKRLRYALIGLFFQALDSTSDRFRSLFRTSEKAYHTVARLVNPVANSRLLRPVRRSVNQVVFKGDSVLRVLDSDRQARRAAQPQPGT